MILERRDGNRLYFSANTENPIFHELQGITLKTTGLCSQLKRAFDGIEGISLAMVYGSFASGNPTPESDIDLLVIGQIGLRQLASKLRIVSDTVGREINPTVISAKSYAKKLKDRDVFISTVAKSQKLWIIGNEHELAELA